MLQTPKQTRPISNTTPEIVITLSNLNQCQIDTLDPLGSDHIPVKLTLNLTPQTPNIRVAPRKPLRFDRSPEE